MDLREVTIEGKQKKEELMLVCREDRFQKLTRGRVEPFLGNGQRVSGFIMAHSYDGRCLSGSIIIELGGTLFLSDELAKRLGPLGPNDLFCVEMWLEGRTLCLNVTATNHFPDGAGPRCCTLALGE